MTHANIIFFLDTLFIQSHESYFLVILWLL